MIKALAYLLGYLVYPFSFLVPRSGRRAVFGSAGGAFEGNAKYLMIRLAEKGEDVVWLSPSRETVARVRNSGLRAMWIFSPRGVWRALRSKTWFVNAYSSDVLWMLSGGARIVNLWHGVGLKRTEFNTVSGPLRKRYVDRSFREAFYHPQVYRRPDFLLTASDFQTPMFMSAFRVGEDRCIKASYPRNAILTAPEADRAAHIARFEPTGTAKLVESLRSFSKVHIYMPTWRDSQREVFIQNMDLQRLNSLLAARNELLLLKPHPYTLTPEVKDLSNITLLDGKIDIYPVLPYVDNLISDYSSVLYDFILMEGKSVVLYLYDYEQYLGERDFFYPFDENVIGERARNMEELAGIIDRGPQPLDESSRKALVEKFWGKNTKDYDFSHYLHL